MYAPRVRPSRLPSWSASSAVRSQRTTSRQEREEARIREPSPLREGPATGPLEPAVAAAHRERHLRAAGRHAELAEQAAEDGVVGLVVDDEARVEREPAVPDGVYVTAWAVMLLEQLHVMSLGQHMRRPEPRHACTDDSLYASNWYSPSGEFRLNERRSRSR